MFPINTTIAQSINLIFLAYIIAPGCQGRDISSLITRKKLMIRKACTADIDAILRLITWGVSEGYVLPRTKEEIATIIHDFFIYEESDTIVGCVSLEIYSKKLAEIRSLVVDSNYHGKGIGQKLVDACIARAKKEAIFEVLAITSKDVFFEKMGFSKCLNGQWPMFMKP